MFQFFRCLVCGRFISSRESVCYGMKCEKCDTNNLKAKIKNSSFHVVNNKSRTVPTIINLAS